MKIRIVKAYKDYKVGDVVTIRTKDGIALINAGYAKADKMMTEYNHG